jgi:hypothetical protein
MQHCIDNIAVYGITLNNAADAVLTWLNRAPATMATHCGATAATNVTNSPTHA